LRSLRVIYWLSAAFGVLLYLPAGGTLRARLG
jgi:hypothetical protein